MVTVNELFDHGLFLEMVEQKMVRVQEHAETDLFIINYASAAQYTSTWNNVTRRCRGLIVRGNPIDDGTAVVVQRPFEKFFNLGEHGDESRHAALPLDRPFEVYGKMDGSLGVLYEGPDGPAVATRGSFGSDQALWATQFLRSHLNGRSVPHGITLLFEIIYPQNRIVVDYGDHEGLTFLAAIEVETGADVDAPDEWRDWSPVVERYHGLNDVDGIVEMIASSSDDWANHEGFVLRFAPERPGQPSPRVKAKFAEYVRLHRIITGVSAKTIWEYLSEGRDVGELLEQVPDEFYNWVRATVGDLQSQFDAVEAQCKAAFADERVDLADRKATALYFQNQPHRAVLFKMLDGRSYAELIWRSLKPKYETPFKIDDEG